MRIDQIRYLIDIGHTHSITKTATRLYATPQAVSKSIKQLESEVGTMLIFRSSAGVSLTDFGIQFVERLGNFVEEYDRLCEEAKETSRDAGENDPELIRVYESSALARVSMPKICKSYNHRHPQTLIRVTTVNHDEVFRALYEGRCDAAFLSINNERFSELVKPFENGQISYVILLKDHMGVCIPTFSPLAAKDCLTPDDLATPNKTLLDIEMLSEGVQSLVELGFDVQNLVLSSSSDIEFHRAALRELGTIVFMPRYVYQTAFTSKDCVFRDLEMAKQTIYHLVLFPTEEARERFSELGDALTSQV